jgi:tRNA threonylcarbamoyladenosine biosynthesis protein TsaB
MRTLVIDTATKACSVALFDGSTCIASHHEVIGRGHAEKLLPIIASLPEKGRADQIMVNIGPGSFTGIRVGISAAKALAFAWGIKAHGYNCLALVAATAAQQTGYPVDVAMAAGHGEYFFQQFDALGIAADQPISLTPEEAASRSGAAPVAGDVAAEFADLAGSQNALVMLPNASNWHFLLNNEFLPARPFYGRMPDAKPAQSMLK